MTVQIRVGLDGIRPRPEMPSLGWTPFYLLGSFLVDKVNREFLLGARLWGDQSNELDVHTFSLLI